MLSIHGDDEDKGNQISEWRNIIKIQDNEVIYRKGTKESD